MTREVSVALRELSSETQKHGSEREAIPSVSY
jgi:hypothetical protein